MVGLSNLIKEIERWCTCGLEVIRSDTGHYVAYTSLESQNWCQIRTQTANQMHSLNALIIKILHIYQELLSLLSLSNIWHLCVTNLPSHNDNRLKAVPRGLSFSTYVCEMHRSNFGLFISHRTKKKRGSPCAPFALNKCNYTQFVIINIQQRTEKKLSLFFVWVSSPIGAATPSL